MGQLLRGEEKVGVKGRGEPISHPELVASGMEPICGASTSQGGDTMD